MGLGEKENILSVPFPEWLAFCKNEYINSMYTPLLLRRTSIRPNINQEAGLLGTLEYVWRKRYLSFSNNEDNNNLINDDDRSNTTVIKQHRDGKGCSCY